MKSTPIETETTEIAQENPTSFPPSPIPFWSNNPNILFQPQYLFELFPMEPMTYEQKLNAVSRTVILLTLFGFILTKSFRLLSVSAITLGAIFILFYYHDKERQRKQMKKVIQEGFDTNNNNNPAMDYLQQNNMPTDSSIFDHSTSQNPFSNVLMTDYDFNPNKKPALPAFANSDVILASAKKQVDEANPDFPQISDKLFKDLGDEMVFEQSLRPFHSNPATTIPNDQGAFAEFCYGDMISCKEGNLFACARNMTRHTL